MLRDEFNCRSRWSDNRSTCAELDFLVTGDHVLERAFKVPSLRNVADRARALFAAAVIACGDVRDARNHTRAALDLVDEREHPALRSQILAAEALTSFLLGDGFDGPAMEQSLRLDDSDPDVPVEWRPSVMMASTPLALMALRTASAWIAAIMTPRL